LADEEILDAKNCGIGSRKVDFFSLISAASPSLCLSAIKEMSKVFMILILWGEGGLSQARLIAALLNRQNGNTLDSIISRSSLRSRR